MLDAAHADQRVSTGLDALDAVLGGLFWGDNVVWLLDGPSMRPFYRAIAGQDDAFDTKTVVSLGGPEQVQDVAGLALIRAGAGSDLPQPEIGRASCRERV